MTHFQGKMHLFLCFISTVSLGFTLPLISIGPTNQTVGIGGTARFRCRIEVSSTISDYSVKWLREGNTIISTNREVYRDFVSGGRYSIIGDTEEDYDLQITEVIPFDQAMFSCQVEQLSIREIETSDSVFLTVQYPPNRDGLRCTPRISEILVEEGERIEPSCRIETAGPPPSLLWMTEDRQNITDSWQVPNFSYNIVLKFARNVSIEDNRKSFICVLYHPLLSESAECRVGPLNVYHAPVNTTITPQNTTFIEGDDIHLDCSADVNPSNDIEFTWASDPQFMGRNITTRSSIYFNNAPLSLNGTVISCNATSSRGYSTTRIVVEVLPRVTQPPKMGPTKNSVIRTSPTEKPGDNLPDTYLIAFILIGVIFVLLLAVVVILVIGRKWREPVIILDVNEELARRSLSGGGSLVLGSNSHIVLHQTPNSERHLFQIHQGHRDNYSITSVDTAESHTEDYPSDPKKAAKIEGTEFHRSAHSSRRNSIDSDCSGSHYERSICSDSRPSTPTRSHDPLPPIPHEPIQMKSLNTNSASDEIVVLEDTEHHADKNYYMNTPTKKHKENGTPREDVPAKRDSGEHKYEDLTPVSKRKLYDKEIETGEEDFPEDDRPRVTPEKQLGEIKDDLLIKM